MSRLPFSLREKVAGDSPPDEGGAEALFLLKFA